MYNNYILHCHPWGQCKIQGCVSKARPNILNLSLHRKKLPTTSLLKTTIQNLNGRIIIAYYIVIHRANQLCQQSWTKHSKPVFVLEKIADNISVKTTIQNLNGRIIIAYYIVIHRVNRLCQQSWTKHSQPVFALKKIADNISVENYHTKS